MAGILAYAIVLRWLMVIVLVGFAFEPDSQLRFTLTLLGWLAVLYLLPAAVLWIYVAITRKLLAVPVPISENETAYRLAEKIIAERRHRVDDFEYQDRTVGLAKAAARSREERAQRAKDLEMQGAFTHWSRRGEGWIERPVAPVFQ